jgi:hypothetical protein
VADVIAAIRSRLEANDFITSYLDTIKTQTAPLSEDSPAPSKDSLVRSFNTPSEGWGKKLDSGLLDKMSDEQLGQLYELRNEVKKSLGEK